MVAGSKSGTAGAYPRELLRRSNAASGAWSPITSERRSGARKGGTHLRRIPKRRAVHPSTFLVCQYPPRAGGLYEGDWDARDLRPLSPAAGWCTVFLRGWGGGRRTAWRRVASFRSGSWSGRLAELRALDVSWVRAGGAGSG
jgi:hypothetical protein